MNAKSAAFLIFYVVSFNLLFFKPYYFKWFYSLVFVLFTTSLAFTQPTNNSCAAAIALGCNTTITGNNQGASDNTLPSCNLVFPRQTVWYRIVGTGTNITLSTCNPGTDFDSQIGVYIGSCGNLTCIAGNNNDPSCGESNRDATVTWASIVNEVYYIVVAGVLGAAGDFELTIECEASTELLCETPEPTSWKELRSEVPLIINYKALKHPNPNITIPINWVVILDDDGKFDLNDSDGMMNGVTIDVDNTIIIPSMDTLNQAFSPGGIQFEICNVSIIKNTYLHYLDNNWRGDDFSYIFSAINIYISHNGFNVTRNFPWFDPLFFNSIHLDANGMQHLPTVVHEMGHIFGLIHTHASDGAYYLGNQDPYDTLSSGGLRELVIRDTVLSKTYPYPNCEYAGDLLCDTPAECAPGVSSSGFNFPDPNDPSCMVFPFIGCQSGCDYSSVTCEYEGNYVDYNGDSIAPPPIGVLGESFMSYWQGCRSRFTDGQFDRVLYHYDTYIAPKTDTSLCGNIQDYVEFEDTNTGLEGVAINYDFPNDTAICNAITDNQGKFEAISYDSLLTSKVFSLGTGEVTGLNIEYTQQDWKKGVSTFDIILGQKHILNVNPLNGYKALAGDVNNSGSFTTLDLITMRKMVLSIIDTFPNQSSPWRYIPEYIPQDFGTDFHDNPFDMTIDGQAALGAPYLEPSWEYTISDGQNGKNGFDAIKLGDLNGSSINDDCPEPSVELFMPSTTIQANTDFDILVKVDSFDSIAGFQLGFFLSHDTLEFIDALPASSLPSFTKDNFGFTKLGNSEFRVVWYDSTATPQTLAPDTTLFILQLKTKVAVSNINDVFQLDNSVLEGQFYASTECSSNEFSLEGQINILEFRTNEQSETPTDNISSTSQIQKLSCYPNPAKDKINVFFKSEISGKGNLIVWDSFGRQVISNNHLFKKGINQITLDGKSFPAGILIISINTKEGRFSQKIVISH